MTFPKHQSSVRTVMTSPGATRAIGSACASNVTACGPADDLPGNGVAGIHAENIVHAYSSLRDIIRPSKTRTGRRGSVCRGVSTVVRNLLSTG